MATKKKRGDKEREIAIPIPFISMAIHIPPPLFIFNKI